VNDLDVQGRLHDLADDLGDPHDEISPASVIALYRRRRRARAALVAAVTAVVAIVVAVPSTIASLSSDGEVAVPSPTVEPTQTVPTTPPAISTTDVPVKPIPPAPSVSPEMLAAERAELAATAALLDSPVRLSSPAEWDHWLPEGKPYPGASTEEEMSTCPRLADRLNAALGVRMSYWTGTLPGGPDGGGCTWATVPLSYDGPYHYPYLVSVGYASDGTVETWRHHFYEHQGKICPDVDVPAVPGAALVRCVNDEVTSYTLVLPDVRREGVWLLEADTRPNAQHPTSFVLTTLVDGVTAAYG
jgi:hypothetical protein